MARTIVSVNLALLLAAGAAGQTQPIQWISNAQQGVAQAKRVGLPLLFYVPGSRDRGDDDLDDAQQAAFRDPRVRSIAESRFVPTRLPLSSDNRAMLQQAGAAVGPGYCLVVMTPEGKLVGVIPPGQVADRRVLAQQLTAMFRKYRSELFEQRLKPLLEQEDARPADVVAAVRQIEKLLILEADQALVSLLERPGLGKGLQKDVYEALAALSTKKSVEALLKAAQQDAQAAKALGRCTPGAAADMLPELKLDDMDKFVIVYEAVTNICNIKGKKPRGFWGGENERLIAEELERVKREVQAAAERWRREYEPYR